MPFMQHRELDLDSMFAGLVQPGKRFHDFGELPHAGSGTLFCDVGYCPAPAPHGASALSDVLPKVGEIFLLQVRPGGDWCGDIEQVAHVMPHWALLPAKKAIGPIAGPVSRLLAFSRDAGSIAVAMLGRGETLIPDEAAVRWMDLRLSGRTGQLMGNVSTTQLLFADLRQQLSSGAVVGPGDVLKIIKANLPILALASRGTPTALVDFGTDRYWWRFLEGLASYIESGRLGPDNPYVHYLRGISASGAYDPGMRFDLADPTRAVERLRPRLTAFLDALTSRALKKPLLIYNPVGVSQLAPFGYSIDDANRHLHLRLRGGREWRIQCIEGNHRLAALWLGGAEACPVVPMWTNVVGKDLGLESLTAASAGTMGILATWFRQTVQDEDSGAPFGPPAGTDPALRYRISGQRRSKKQKRLHRQS